MNVSHHRGGSPDLSTALLLFSAVQYMYRSVLTTVHVLLFDSRRDTATIIVGVPTHFYSSYETVLYGSLPLPLRGSLARIQLNVHSTGTNTDTICTCSTCSQYQTVLKCVHSLESCSSGVQRFTNRNPVIAGNRLRDRSDQGTTATEIVT